jgi:NADH-quinone oxidoreductase subunit N
MLPVLPRQVTPLLWLDRYGAFFYALFAAAGLLTALLSYRYLQRRRGDLEGYYVLLVTATIGAMTMASAAHFASFLLGLEILSLSLYVLVGYPEEHHAPLEAALKYLLLSGVASTTMLFGMALIYLQTGTLEFAALACCAQVAARVLSGRQCAHPRRHRPKLSLVFRLWTPDVRRAPAPISGYLATVGKAVFALALRYVLTPALASPSLFFAVSAVAVLSMVVGNLLALMQQNVKRILAYSSIAHLGYLLIALLVVSSAANPALGTETALVYLAAYFAMTLGAFAIVTAASGVEAGRDADAITDPGLFWRRPVLAAKLRRDAVVARRRPDDTLGIIASSLRRRRRRTSGYCFGPSSSAASFLLLPAHHLCVDSIQTSPIDVSAQESRPARLHCRRSAVSL